MPNLLAHETSPYLQQHAGNPVEWHAWNAASLQLARDLDKPILLSIGYSACHWCHVMAHESFEDADVAAVMNTHFINIKVDREERPDLDQIYQTAHHLLTRRSGGWPLTMFLSPDGVPFFGGTYFPKEARYGLPGFIELMERVAEAYAEQRSEITEQGKHLLAALHHSASSSEQAMPLNDQPLVAAVQHHLDNFDSEHGGFGDAPKFLHPAELDLLLRCSHATSNQQAAHAVNFTMQQMAHGGLYDQLGGGFCRYSVDERWDIPHFEKMLYDNGLLLAVYCDAWQASQNPLFARVVEQTATWLVREMQSPEGGYYSSLDTDSEHEEGKFYVWQRDEIRQLLSAEEYALIELYYGLNHPPNFEHHAWNLRVSIAPTELTAKLGISPAQATERLISAQKKLFAAREQRVRPGRDEKILGAWNGLMIAGMAKAARTFASPEWLRSAQRAMDFIHTTLWRDGKLLATYKDGKAHLNAYLDDHTFLLNGLLELLQAEYRAADMAFATQLADALLERFEDKENSGFFFTSHDHEQLIQRNKIGHDNVTPSGNGIAAQALLKLSLLTGETKYAAAAERCLMLFSPTMQQLAGYHSSLCTALDMLLHLPSLLILRGQSESLAAWQAALRVLYLPNLMTITLPNELTGLPATLDKPASEQPMAWLCQGTQCLPVITRLEELLDRLVNSSAE
jgi:uncharacterized protein YyaL (SSP411 family)